MKATVTCLALWFTAFLACASGEKVCLIKINGAIGPATASYISRSIGEAQSQNAQCLIIQLNTPGGLLDSTQVIVQKLLASPVPVVVYVAPIGATATSAGCFITLAASVAAMAPATTIGAAHPVMIGGGIPSGDGQKPDDTMKQKLENFAVSYIEAIAAKRNRNVEWAKSAVRESASIPVDKALELKVIEIIAKDLSDLQQQLDGRVVEGKELKTAGAEVIEIAMSASETDLSIAVAAGGDVRPHAGGDLRNHWRTEHAWRDSAWRGRCDCVGACALHGSDSADQCDGSDS